MYIYKAWENKQVLESSLMNNAFFNAYMNANRKQGSTAVPLWKKKKNRAKKETAEEMRKTMQEIEEYEKKNGKDWYKKILEANK